MARASLRIAIVGAGNIGCYLAACLFSAGYRPLLVGREHIAKDLAAHGLRVSDYRGRDVSVAPGAITYQTHLEGMRQFDVILLTVKSAASLALAEQLKGKINEKAIVVSLQNGVTHIEPIRARLMGNAVLRGVVAFNVVRRSAGHYHQGSEGGLCIESLAGELSTSRAALEGIHLDLLHALNQSQLETQVYNDMLAVQWAKLLMNLNNAINALSGQTLLVQLQDAGYRKCLALCIDEALEVLQQANIRPARMGKVIPRLMPAILRLPNWAFTRVASAMLAIDPSARSSMADDIALGRPTEIAVLNGEVVNLAKRTGCLAPVNQCIVDLVRDLEQNSNKHRQSAEGLRHRLESARRNIA